VDVFQPSPIYTTVFDDPSIRVSIFRTRVWHGLDLRPLRVHEELTFGVVWDEDRDERVFELVDVLAYHGHLSGVRFVGEHKGSSTILLYPDAKPEVYAKYNGYEIEGDAWSLYYAGSDMAKTEFRLDDPKVQSVLTLYPLGLSAVRSVARPDTIKGRRLGHVAPSWGA
jgi:hypothetical protein